MEIKTVRVFEYPGELREMAIHSYRKKQTAPEKNKIK